MGGNGTGHQGAARNGAAAAAPLLALDKLRLTVGSGAGEVNILRGISLSVAAGETVGIVGPSGSGKTSLLMVVAGLERATGGTVRVAGHELGGMDEDALARFRRDHVGIVFQAFHLVPTMTALENVAIPLEFAGRADAFQRAEEMLREVGLGHRLTHYPGQLSGGEQQRVALARALVARPRLILADEPTGNLDLANGQAVMELLFGLAANHGATLFLITHDPKLAARCGRTITIADGQIVGDARCEGAANAPGMV
ncbi:MAG: ABC transporter ATP-binding protein [Alphaproteobacteria bacterium]|nr:ABC transporter ATP-binding protein [Alphaproteobacteria bacterium]